MIRYKFLILAILFVTTGCVHSALQATKNSASLQAARDALTQGEAGTALAIARGVLASQPDNVSALTQSGDAEAALGDRLAATRSYKQALAISPHDVGARLGQGKLALRDDLKEAEVIFRAVLLDAPKDALALNDLGYVLDLQDRHKEAQNSYMAALVVDPDHVATQVNLALSMALSGQPEHAEQLLRDLVTSASASRKIRLDFAVAQVLAGHDQDAEQTLSGDLSAAEARSAIDGVGQLRSVVASPR